MSLKTVLLLLIALQSCTSKTHQQDEWDKNNLRSFEVDDIRVKNAYKTAQDSLPFYIAYFKENYGKENFSFFLKKNFEEDGKFEHMWSRPFDVSKTGFRCILDNEPEELTNYNLGDTVQIDFIHVEDFIIITGDTAMIGNYLNDELD